MCVHATRRDGLLGSASARSSVWLFPGCARLIWTFVPTRTCARVEAARATKEQLVSKSWRATGMRCRADMRVRGKLNLLGGRHPEGARAQQCATEGSLSRRGSSGNRTETLPLWVYPRPAPASYNSVSTRVPDTYALLFDSAPDTRARRRKPPRRPGSE